MLKEEKGREREREENGVTAQERRNEEKKCGLVL